MKLTTMEIARRAGVSQATVSRVLNGHPVGPEKYRQVQSVLESIGEKKWDLKKKPLKLRQIFGILLVDEQYSHPNIILRKLNQILSELQYQNNLIILPKQITALQLESKFRKGEIHGLILIGHTARDPQLSKLIGNVPHVWLNSHETEEQLRETPDPFPMEKTLSGNEAAGRLAGRYLHQHHCRNCHAITFASCNPGIKARLEGFAFELFRAGKSVTMLHLEEKIFEETSDSEVITLLEHQFADFNWQQVDGLFSPDDRLTALLWYYWSKHHKATRPGERIKLISCNNEPEYLAALYPRPATIELCPELTVHLALEELHSQVSGNQSNARITVVVNPILIEAEKVV